MKKANTSPQAQARRRRALERFNIAPQGTTSADEYAKYVARKEIERAALLSRVG